LRDEGRVAHCCCETCISIGTRPRERESVKRRKTLKRVDQLWKSEKGSLRHLGTSVYNLEMTRGAYKSWSEKRKKESEEEKKEQEKRTLNTKSYKVIQSLTQGTSIL